MVKVRGQSGVVADIFSRLIQRFLTAVVASRMTRSSLEPGVFAVTKAFRSIAATHNGL